MIQDEIMLHFVQFRRDADEQWKTVGVPFATLDQAVEWAKGPQSGFYVPEKVRDWRVIRAAFEVLP